MKYLKLIFIIVLISNEINAKIIDGVGLNLGMNHGLGDLSSHLKTGFQANLFAETGKIGFIQGECNFGLMYLEKKNDPEIHLLMVPITFLFVYTMQDLLHMDKFEPVFKAGMGVVPQKLTISDHSIINNIDPALTLAVGLERYVTKRISVFMQASFLYIIQKHLPVAYYNGNFLSVSMGIII